MNGDRALKVVLVVVGLISFGSVCGARACVGDDAQPLSEFTSIQGGGEVSPSPGRQLVFSKAD
jgi:hypothetical protein